jgi:hypothetical protein
MLEERLDEQMLDIYRSGLDFLTSPNATITAGMPLRPCGPDGSTELGTVRKNLVVRSR